MTISNLFLLLSLFHFANDKKIEGRKRLQKLVCILKHGHSVPFSYNFIPYYYGPYSEDLTDTVDSLVGLGLLTETKEMYPSGIPKYVYELTPQGTEKVEGNIKTIQSEIDLDKLQTLTKTLDEKSTEDLVFESKQTSKLYE